MESPSRGPCREMIVVIQTRDKSRTKQLAEGTALEADQGRRGLGGVKDGTVAGPEMTPEVDAFSHAVYGNAWHHLGRY